VGDLPDWTTPIRVKGTDVMVAIDVQGGYIMLPVDFQDQFVGMLDDPQWQSLQGNHKTKYKESGTLTWSQSFATVDYAPPAGKSLFITGMGFSIYAKVDTDYDHHLRGEAVLYCSYLGNEVAVVGGEGGGGVIFPTPIRVPATEAVSVRGTNWTNLNAVMKVAWWGYER